MDNQAANAHHIARHLRAIANILQSSPEPLMQEASAAIGDGILIALGPNAGLDLNLVAETLEATAPFTPLTDAEKGEVFEFIADDVSDYSTRERVELVTNDWTEVDWRIEYDQQQEYMSEDE